MSEPVKKTRQTRSWKTEATKFRTQAEQAANNHRATLWWYTYAAGTLGALLGALAMWLAGG